MNRTSPAFRISLTATFTALQVVFLSIGFFVGKMILTFNALSALCLVVPIAFGYKKEALLSYFAVSIIVFFVNPLTALPYVAFSGLFSLLSILLREKIKYAYTIPVKIIWGNGVFFAFFYLLDDFIVFPMEIPTALLVLGVSFVVILYDYILHICYSIVQRKIDKIK